MEINVSTHPVVWRGPTNGCRGCGALHAFSRGQSFARPRTSDLLCSSAALQKLKHRNDMTTDQIEEVHIDSQGRLHVKPASATFPHIYREAMGVHWTASTGTLHSPVLREWTHARWFKQILAAAQEQSCALRLSTVTRWINVPERVRNEISAESDS